MRLHFVVVTVVLLCLLLVAAFPSPARPGINVRPIISKKSKKKQQSRPRPAYQRSYQPRYYPGYQSSYPYDPTGHGDPHFSFYYTG